MITRLRFRNLIAAPLLALALTACETTGDGPGSMAEVGPPAPPMTHSRAAQECWMRTEKGAASMNLDKRADLVDRCIEEKMKAAGTAPKA